MAVVNATHLGDKKCAKLWWIDRVANGDVTVGAHDGQQQGTSELIHRRRRHVDLHKRNQIKEEED